MVGEGGGRPGAWLQEVTAGIKAREGRSQQSHRPGSLQVGG